MQTPESSQKNRCLCQDNRSHSLSEQKKTKSQYFFPCFLTTTERNSSIRKKHTLTGNRDSTLLRTWWTFDYHGEVVQVLVDQKDFLNCTWQSRLAETLLVSQNAVLNRAETNTRQVPISQRRSKLKVGLLWGKTNKLLETSLLCQC